MIMITMKNVIREGHKTLATVAKPVKLPLTAADKRLLKDLLQFVKNSQDPDMIEAYDLRPAVGIAAPQVNVSKRMYAVHVNDFDGTLYSYALINPVITAKSKELIYVPGGEGCLSVDRETEGITPRYKAITLEALSYDEPSDKVIPIKLNLSGYIGIVFQHELDHLDGILFTSKLFPAIPNAEPAFEISEAEEDAEI